MIGSMNVEPVSVCHWETISQWITLSSMEERNSLEETDKIRVSLGFKSLVDAGPDNDSEVIAESKQHESKCVAPAYLAPSANVCPSPFRDIAN
jgi:hypothetical protein